MANHRFHRPSENSEIMDRRQVMARYGWSSNFLWKAMRVNGLSYRKQGRKLMFIRSEVEKWIEDCPREAVPQTPQKRVSRRAIEIRDTGKPNPLLDPETLSPVRLKNGKVISLASWDPALDPAVNGKAIAEKETNRLIVAADELIETDLVRRCRAWIVKHDALVQVMQKGTDCSLTEIRSALWEFLLASE